MAEIAIKIGDGTGFKDGDILDAFNDRRIGMSHASHICDVRRFGFNSDGLRPNDTLAEKFLFRTKLFKFQRVSRKEILRTNLVTAEWDLLSDIANDQGEAIDLDLYLRRRKSHNTHLVFGVEDSEIWYGGADRADEAGVNAVWSDIEAGSAYRRTDHQLAPVGFQSIKSHLIIRTQDFTEEEAGLFVRPRLQRDQEGAPVLDQEGRPIVLEKRAIHTDWTFLLEEIQETAATIRDRSIPVGKTVQIMDLPERAASKDQPLQTNRARLGDKERGIAPVK